MELHLFIVGFITLVFGAITKAFIEKIPNRLIPIQNVAIGVTSAAVLIAMKIETDIITALKLCIAASLVAGGGYDAGKALITKHQTKDDEGEL